jgi:hypothetical protein
LHCLLVSKNEINTKDVQCTRTFEHSLFLKALLNSDSKYSNFLPLCSEGAELYSADSLGPHSVNLDSLKPGQLLSET